MKKPVAIGIAVVAGVVAIGAPIALSLWWAEQRNLEEQVARVDRAASVVLARMDQMADETFEMFRVMKAGKAIDPCSEQNIRLMRRVAMEKDQLRAVGYVKNDYMVCSSFGRHDTGRPGIPLGPTFVEPSRLGSVVRAKVRFELLPGMTFLTSTEVSSGYTAIIRSEQALLGAESDITWGVFLSAKKTPLVSSGDINPAWMEALGNAPERHINLGGYLVALKKSPRYNFASFAAIKQSSVAEGLRQTAMVMVPAGLAAGLVLALAVFYVTRYQMSLRSLIKGALRRHEFFLVYQPIIELRGGSCIGAEALIRWRRPDGSFVRPDLFIPVAEESGLIHEITKEVMLLVARDASRFLRANPRLHIAINLSSKDLVMAETGQLLKDLILGMGVRAANIMVEATERGFMQAEVARRIMDDIHSLQVKIAIDDFGTGYSSLSYLEKFKLDYLKIDKSFVDTMGGETATSQVAPHIIEMAKSLKLEMIAEGVETEAQVRYLQQRGVQYAQGYFYAKPMPFAEFAAYVAKIEKLVAEAA
jgi:sensor c-di-GMP phosphodiesterase-like protein